MVQSPYSNIYSGSTRSRSCARWTDAPPPEGGANDTDGHMFIGGMVALCECAAAARAGRISWATTARSRRARARRSGSTRSRPCARWTDAPPPEGGATDADGRIDPDRRRDRSVIAACAHTSQ